jgi:hypothetical protein
MSELAQLLQRVVDKVNSDPTLNPRLKLPSECWRENGGEEGCIAELMRTWGLTREQALEAIADAGY